MDVYLDEKETLSKIQLPNIFKDHQIVAQPTSTTVTARKTVFPRSWNIMEGSKRPSKYHLSINFLAEKRSYFPSPKNLKPELLGNQ